MLSLTYSRKSVCMGDDAGCGDYTLELPDGATLGELMKVLLRGGCGNDWPIPYTGANSFWVIRSNIGRLGAIHTDCDGEWHIHCNPYPADTPLKQLGLTWTFADRDYEEAAEQYSDQDLRHAAEFRDSIHRDALEKLRETHPEINEVVDRWPVEAYFQENWDYPGRWYTIVAIPKECRSRKALIDTIVHDTLAQRSGSKLDAPPLPAAEPFSVLFEDYPEADADIYIVKDAEPCRGLASHRRALAAACKALNRRERGGGAWRFDLDAARGWPVSADAPFLPPSADGAATLRKAVLDPPHGSHYGDADFEALCATLFPRGRGRLEVFEWSTDWSDYFDDGHEWWGAMCCTVYDRSMDRYAVLLASETD